MVLLFVLIFTNWLSDSEKSLSSLTDMDFKVITKFSTILIYYAYRRNGIDKACSDISSNR